MNTSEHLADAISAASLVLAVLAALYTLWLPAVNAALEITRETDPDDRDPQRKQVKSALLTKALPLAAATIVSTGILLPRGLAIIMEAWDHHADWAFDDVKAFFVLTLALMLLLAIVSICQIVALVRKRREIG
ncbi:hypothetical protein [Rhizobium rhizogenes]|uniref:hypothetical protein n=1 Tax=Rhizobium rhizogenes TaxID=359 RepID=UPI0015735A85|nr:hypothetical protein [Rhizobium rhizogenes]NTF46619.1 hypothetical protein [Rhizobium rhizogenes]